MMNSMNNDDILSLNQTLLNACKSLTVAKESLQLLKEKLEQSLRLLEQIVEYKTDGQEATDEPEKIVADNIPNYNGMSKSELKELCRIRNLKVSGTIWDLVTRLVSYDSMKTPSIKTPSPPPKAFAVFHLKSLERQSNTHKLWLAKCHSGKKCIKLYLHYADSTEEKALLSAVCDCGKSCLCARPLSIIDDDGLSSLTFEAMDSSASWSNYICRFKAEFECREIAKKFKRAFVRYARNDLINDNVDNEYNNDDDQELFQSQRLF